MGRLDGQVSIVTGGSRGIGRAVALKFVDEGARVAVVAAHDRDALRQIEQEIAARGGDSIATLADVSRRGDVEGVVQAALTK
ncbi:MAG TPA: SDR family NAD(P)-dependent oxidoreductase, partial [Candidatus Binatia bacterium]|nr:SDR family NAD(P)-dependent oxidoreductase [Candidatus Binatia bacterium]